MHMTRVKFLRESLKNLKSVGTLTRSSSALSKEMIKPVDFSNAKVIVELGAGDGAITKHILSQMGQDTKLYAFELHGPFCTRLEKLGDDRLEVIQKDAAQLKEIMASFGHSEVDYVISAIPFVALSEKETLQIVGQARDLLSSAGKFVQVHYSLVLKKLYKKLFTDVRLNFVLRNLPPAWVFVCGE